MIVAMAARETTCNFWFCRLLTQIQQTDANRNGVPFENGTASRREYNEVNSSIMSACIQTMLFLSRYDVLKPLGPF